MIYINELNLNSLFKFNNKKIIKYYINNVKIILKTVCRQSQTRSPFIHQIFFKSTLSVSTFAKKATNSLNHLV